MDLPPIATLDEPPPSSPVGPADALPEPDPPTPEAVQPPVAAPVVAPKPKPKPRPKPAVRTPGQTLLPLPRVQKIMKADADLLPVSKEAMHVISVATEEFLKRLSKASHKLAASQRRTTVNYRDAATAVQHGDQLQFLHETIPLAVSVSVAFQRRNAKAGDMPNGEGSHAESERRSVKGKGKARVNLIVNGKANGKEPPQPMWVGTEADAAAAAAAMMHWGPPPHMYPPNGFFPGWGPPPGMMPMPPGQPYLRGPEWFPHPHMPPPVPPHMRGAPPMPTHRAHPLSQTHRAEPAPHAAAGSGSGSGTASRRSSRRMSASNAVHTNGNGHAHVNGDDQDAPSPSSTGASPEFHSAPGRTIYTPSLDPRLLQS